MTNPIPRAALDDRLGFIGTSGSGKTYAAGTAVEILLDHNARVVIVDPLGVWWGLRLLADGKTPSNFDVAIFGGAHGDLPLTENAGALIGETAATMAESCIIDLSELRGKAAERRFMTAFLDTIYLKATKEPFHLIVDEADLFAPQKPAKGAETLLGHMEDIVRRGRVKGFIPWLISQRPAVINKNVLSQVDGLIAFKLTATQDRDALDDWIEGQADKGQGKAIKDALPTLQIGQGVVWLPGHGILKTTQFPTKVTFDSSRTPKRGEKVKSRSLKPLNVDALKARLASVEEAAKADNPPLLRKEIAALRAQKAKLSAELDKWHSSTAKLNPQEIKAAEQKGFEQAKKKFGPAADRAFQRAVAELTKIVATRVQEVNVSVVDALKEFRANIPGIDAEVSYEPSPAPAPVIQRPPHPTPRIVQRDVVRPPPASDGAFTRPQMRVLRSLAMWKSLGHHTPSREMVAAVAGYSPSSGGFNNLLGSLGPKAMGAIGIPSPGKVLLEIDSIDVPSVDEGRELLLSVLTNPQKKLVAALNGAGATTREQLGEATGYSASSGGFNNLIGSLNTLGISYVPAQGHVSLSDWAQELLNGYEVRAAA